VGGVDELGARAIVSRSVSDSGAERPRGPIAAWGTNPPSREQERRQPADLEVAIEPSHAQGKCQLRGNAVWLASVSAILSAFRCSGLSALSRLEGARRASQCRVGGFRPAQSGEGRTARRATARPAGRPYRSYPAAAYCRELAIGRLQRHVAGQRTQPAGSPSGHLTSFGIGSRGPNLGARPRSRRPDRYLGSL
jgi:hypothetical protein